MPLRVTVELIPRGDESRKRKMAVVDITNDGTGTHEVGNYISEATAAKPTERVCRWIMSANGYTTTECGYIVQSNERRACPYCGGKIIEEVRT